jgi:nitrate/nitrite transporter NarK
MASCGLGTVGLLLSISVSPFWVSFAWLTMALAGITAARAIFWTIPPRFLSGVAAAGGLAFINAIATMGGFVGPAAVGWLRDATGSFAAGLAGMAGFLLLSVILTALLGLVTRRG